jgi:hypothetical protein
MTRTGVEVPGVGYVGEKVVIDPRKVEARRRRRWSSRGGTPSSAGSARPG